MDLEVSRCCPGRCPCGGVYAGQARLLGHDAVGKASQCSCSPVGGCYGTSSSSSSSHGQLPSMASLAPGQGIAFPSPFKMGKNALLPMSIFGDYFRGF